jgi:parallel beta-helix repeat protein
MGKSEPKWRARRVMGAAVAVLLAAGTARAQLAPRPRSCPLVITKCGCVIDSEDTYVAANQLLATHSGQICIEITASRAILNLKGNNVLGKNDGTGTGIRIDREADHVVVEGGDKTGDQATVSDWNIGIEDDGNSAVVGLFAAVGAASSNDSGNNTGVFLKSVDRSVVTALNANGNQTIGILLSNSTRSTVFNFSANGNGQAGLKLDSSDRNTIGPGGAESNDQYGIWLNFSSGNTIRDSNGNQMNHDTGILLGGGSNRNRIVSGGAPENDQAGIVIQRGSTDNTVSVTHNQGNGSPNSDMVDLNFKCDNNVWYNNVGNGNQSCIH